MGNNTTYCNFENFRQEYKNNYGYISMAVCIFGSITNISNIWVLMTKHMRSPTNFILTGLAVSDLLLMLAYIPFLIIRHFLPNRLYASFHTHNMALYLKYHALITLSLHFTSCCLTIILAIWRYIFVSRLQSNNICNSLKTAVIVVCLTFVICPFICLPAFFLSKIEVVNQTVSNDGKIVLMKDRDDHNQTRQEPISVLMPDDPHNLSIWIYSIVAKLLPTILLSILSYLIISALVETKKRRRKLLSSCNAYEDLNGRHKHDNVLIYKENQADRTTKMLLAVLFLFLLTEFPQAILLLVGGILGGSFIAQCYTAFGDLLDAVALINSSINFILYCSMSRQFRVTFQEIFSIKGCICCLPKQANVQEENGAETKMSLV